MRHLTLIQGGLEARPAADVGLQVGQAIALATVLAALACALAMLYVAVVLMPSSTEVLGTKRATSR